MTEHTPAGRSRSRSVRLNCQQVTEMIRAYLDGELDAETHTAFEEHMRRCSDCVAYINTYKRTIQVAQSLSYDDIPAEMQKRVGQFLRAKLKRSQPGS